MPQFTKEDVCYLKHGESQIMARVFKPEGPGPFPAYVDLHGGAWNNGDLNDRTGLGEYLAQRGYVMVTLNFRHAADGYPDPKTGECTQISTAFTIEALPAFVLHQPGDNGGKKTAQAGSAGHQE